MPAPRRSNSALLGARCYRRGMWRASLSLCAVCALSCGGVVLDGGDQSSPDAAAPGASPRDAGSPFTVTANDAAAPTRLITDKTNACGLIDGLGAADLSRFAPESVGLYFAASVDEECTNLGGAHVTWKLIEPCLPSGGAALVHEGGHGCRLGGAPSTPGDFAVIGSVPGAPSPSAALCLESAPRASATARLVVPVASRDEGTKLLAAQCPRPLGGR